MHACITTLNPRLMATACDAWGLTPLHYAAAADDSSSCRLLMDCGSSLLKVATTASYESYLPCNAGMTALHVAAMNNSFAAANAMLLAWVCVDD